MSYASDVDRGMETHSCEKSFITKDRMSKKKEVTICDKEKKKDSMKKESKSNTRKTAIK